MTTDLQSATAATAAIAVIDPTSTLDEVTDAIGKLATIKAWLKDREKELDASLVEYIEVNGEFTIGDIRYFTGPDHKVKCRDVGKLLLALVQFTGGDLDALGNYQAIVGCIASGGWKHGAVKKLLAELKMPERVDEFFETTTDTVLKLQVVNTRYLP